ncbi:MAG: hypothetical protein JNJ46_26390 [Myxococcales bacterium]|nr:hypothetical protein [Myxococcales bacterium]
MYLLFAWRCSAKPRDSVVAPQDLQCEPELSPAGTEHVRDAIKTAYAMSQRGQHRQAIDLLTATQQRLPHVTLRYHLALLRLRSAPCETAEQLARLIPCFEVARAEHNVLQRAKAQHAEAQVQCPSANDQDYAILDSTLIAPADEPEKIRLAATGADAQPHPSTQHAPRDIAASHSARELPAQGPQPLYKRWWFWTALGLTITGGAVGLGIGLQSMTARGPIIPDGYFRL